MNTLKMKTYNYIIKFIISFCVKHKEILLYVIFGGFTTIISIATFAFFNVYLGVNELIANIFSWILSVLFAFITNLIWVFGVWSNNFSQFFYQMIAFYGGRVATLIIEEVILWIFIGKLSFNSIAVKAFAQIIVIVLNYIISKVFVFRKFMIIKE